MHNEQDATNTVIKKQSRKKFAHSRCYLQRRGNRQNAKLEWAIFRPPVLSAVQCARVVVVAYCCVQEGRQKVIILKLMNVSSQRICSSCLCVRAGTRQCNQAEVSVWRRGILSIMEGIATGKANMAPVR